MYVASGLPKISVDYCSMAPPSYILYTPAGSFRAFAPLIAAECNHIDVTVETEGVETAAKAKSPTGKAPLLETPKGVIFSSAAIARYIGGLRTDTGLLGNSFQERAAVDNWIDWSSAQVELPACVLFYPVAGYMTMDEGATAKATDDMKKALQVLQDHLVEREYLVGKEMTMADIVLVSTLVYPFKLVCDEAFLGPYDRVVRWFTTCVKQPEFVAVLGPVEICKEPVKPITSS